MESDKDNTNSMWGGRFHAKPDELMLRFNQSISFDKTLYAEDIEGSIAHAKMLAKQKIIASDDAEKIVHGLQQIKGEIENGKFTFRTELEDIHMNIEARLKEIIGEAASRLHTARSRNDQVALDFRMWVIKRAHETASLITTLQKALLDTALQHADTIMPGFTHLQVAQPITFGHHLMAYVEMLQRDKTRLHDAIARANLCPLGAAALAGTGYNIDRDFVAEQLGFASPTRNSLDSVASRDFALEYLSCLSITMINLSRMAEELVNWSSQQFNFIQLSDTYSTGSSIMPQKRNPDSAELIRGKCGRVIGSLNSLLITMKGLPLAYNKDMQEDKEPVFDASYNTQMCIQVMTGAIAGMTVNKAKMREAATKGYSTATDLADYLVRELGIAFRNAHHITGSIVKLAESSARQLHEVTLTEMQIIEPNITEKVFEFISVEKSVNSRNSFGGTAPIQVKAAIKHAQESYI